MTILVFCPNVSVQTRILFTKLTLIFQNAWKQIDKTQNCDVKIFYSSLNNEYGREELKHSKAKRANYIQRRVIFACFFVGITGSWKTLEVECRLTRNKLVMNKMRSMQMRLPSQN